MLGSARVPFVEPDQQLRNGGVMFGEPCPELGSTAGRRTMGWVSGVFTGAADLRATWCRPAPLSRVMGPLLDWGAPEAASGT